MGPAAPVRRVSVVGTSGSGKTRFSRALAARLGVPHVELDAIHHQPGWVPLAPEPFRATVRDVTAIESWVVDGNYSVVRDLVWARADTVVHLDPPRWRVVSQIVARTLVRVATGRELWNGNRERLSELASLDPERNIVLWSWTTFERNRRRYARARRDPRWSHLHFVQLTSRAEQRAFVEAASVR